MAGSLMACSLYLRSRLTASCAALAVDQHRGAAAGSRDLAPLIRDAHQGAGGVAFCLVLGQHAHEEAGDILMLQVPMPVAPLQKWPCC